MQRVREKTRQAITAALFEAFFVVLAVALALAANEWRQGVADRRQASSALASIVEELQSNRTAVAEALTYHSGRLELLQELQREPRAPDPRAFPRGFVAPAQLFATAWASATATGALAHMDYDTVLELSRIYARQERYEQQARSVAEIIYGELFRHGVGGVVENLANLGTLISTFAYREQQLLEYYDQTLGGLGVVAQAPPPPGPSSADPSSSGS